MANPKIVGYGVVGPNEPYLTETLKEFARLCDEVILCLNNVTLEDRNIIESYGFKTTVDNREWGVNQWRIKEDFVTKYVSQLHPDICVCLDMDEVFDKNLTKEGIYELFKTPFEAFYFRIINLWDDGYSPDRTFWNIRMWKWTPLLGTRWPRKNLHCGLAPDWTWGRAFYAPYILKHYGLKDKERRELKAQRYEKYDPKAKFISREYYDSLRKDMPVLPFDEDALHKEVAQYVKDIKQKYVKMTMQENDLVEIKIPNGQIIPIPRNKLPDYIKRPGHEYVGEFKKIADEIDAIMEETVQHTVEKVEEPVEPPKVLGKLRKKWSWEE